MTSPAAGAYGTPPSQATGLYGTPPPMPFHRFTPFSTPAPIADPASPFGAPTPTPPPPPTHPSDPDTHMSAAEDASVARPSTPTFNINAEIMRASTSAPIKKKGKGRGRA